MNERVLTLAVLLAVTAGAVADDSAKKDLDKLRGAWEVVKGEEEGTPANDYLVEHLKVEIKGNKLTFRGIKPLTDKARKLTIKLDASTAPRCIDLKVDVGSMKGDVIEGIYELKGGRLKLCLSVADGVRNRPLDFKTKAGSRRVMLVLKRQAP
jgi:uncharacterized protein (TIGR03067 family)